MILDSVNNLYKLDSIIAAASQTGNTALVTAATTVRDELKAKATEGITQYTDGAKEFAKAALESGIESGANKLLNLLPGMKAAESVGKLVSKIVDWGEVYDSAEVLMTLQVMNGHMDIYTALSEEDSAVMAELWGYLQVRGCDAANDFLEKYADKFPTATASWLSTGTVNESNVIDAQTTLNNEKESYKQFIQNQHNN